MSDEATFFLPVKDYCRRQLMTCHVNDTVMVAAEIMRDKSVSSLIACDDNKQPIGIMTDRDLRNKVVAGGVDPLLARVSSVMTTPVISVNEDDTLFEVLYQMSRNRIHRVGVVDTDKALVGLINESDIIRLQDRSPQRLLQAVDEAESIADLKKIYHDSEQLVIFLHRNGVRTNDLIQMIALINDQITAQLTGLLKQGRFKNMGQKSAFMVLGSEGRREQTLKTDQDNAMIIADDAGGDELADIEAFSHVLIDALIEIGVPECPGGIMARNKFWRRRLVDWKSAINHWVGTPNGQNILNFSMFSDMRTLCGDPNLEDQLKDYIIKVAEENSIFLARMAQNVCRFSPPLGMFGQIKVESSGVHLGSLDLKKAGIFALTEGVKVLALSAGMLGGSTHERMTFLQQQNILSKEQVLDIEASFNLLTFLRLRGQVNAVAAGQDITNYISPGSLDRVEKGRLKLALEVVKSFQGSLNHHFQLNMLKN
ncbi:CBS domain-containing protein [Desulfuromusa kysingii]|uniref:CBS domain-containing protein n=1 Tax=Desulfuromusa kysingii TaxID=37625 RepID=A0A1H4DI51_9BACT|nr:putative nucleotidyltransferase substrate binding domain-containing protein [Desulfuromusa kysingii]SEA72228.1 CBS domain-containing protein [Desulfuromusa kysingii]